MQCQGTVRGGIHARIFFGESHVHRKVSRARGGVILSTRSRTETVPHRARKHCKPILKPRRSAPHCVAGPRPRGGGAEVRPVLPASQGHADGGKVERSPTASRFPGRESTEVYTTSGKPFARHATRGVHARPHHRCSLATEWPGADEPADSVRSASSWEELQPLVSSSLVCAGRRVFASPLPSCATVCWPVLFSRRWLVRILLGSRKGGRISKNQRN